MKTTCKVLVALTLICALPGCCSCCGRGCDICQRMVPSWGNCPVAAATTPKMGVIVSQPGTLADEMMPPQIAMR
jgi:hypothetical protein